jgi:hypothetical protein
VFWDALSAIRLCGGIVCPRKRARGRTGRYGSPGFISAAAAAGKPVLVWLRAQGTRLQLTLSFR